MDDILMGIVFVLAMVFAFVGGVIGWTLYLGQKKRTSHMKALVKGAQAQGDNAGPGEFFSPSDIDSRVLAFAYKEGKKIAVQQKGQRLPDFFQSQKWFEKNSRLAGLEGQVSAQGFYSAQLKMAVGFAGIFGVIGTVFSGQLGLILAAVGLCLGYQLPKRAVSNLISYRSKEMEHHLPEMLDVLALCMRSGLSFDASIAMYSTHFKTMLARDLSLAYRQWTSGLASREDALRSVADSYNTPVFSRVVETIIRSIRFGSSMVASIEAQRDEARLAYRTRREEAVAKAPVKMMIPTGTLILPAMLIMVLGPVLLELIGNAF